MRALLVAADVQMHAVTGRRLDGDLAGAAQERGAGAVERLAVSPGKSSATIESATSPSVPPTSSAGTTSSAPRPTASIVRGPPFIATSSRPKSDRSRSAERLTSDAPITSRLSLSGAAGSTAALDGVVSSTSTPPHALGCTNAIGPARPERGAGSRAGRRASP